MTRLFAPLVAPAVGLLFVLALLIAAFMPRQPATPLAQNVFHLEPKDISYSFDGPFGRYDREQLQRGFVVYKEVCSACHSMKLVAFRDLEGIGFTKPEVKAIAAQWQIKQPTINPDTGDATTRPNIPSDHFPSPFPNDTAARAANDNALPPDMSLLAKAREGGPAYIASIVTGYEPQPAKLLAQFPDAKTPTGLYYNPYFANLNIHMPPPLTSDGQVTYADGTKATRMQMATDVSAFLMWAAEPKMENRKRTGVSVVIYLLFATVLAYFAYRNVWAGKKH